jgi:hypothetical protein
MEEKIFPHEWHNYSYPDDWACRKCGKDKMKAENTSCEVAARDAKISAQLTLYDERQEYKEMKAKIKRFMYLREKFKDEDDSDYIHHFMIMNS